MKLYSYISGGQVVLESMFDAEQPANIVCATPGAWCVKIYIKYRLLDNSVFHHVHGTCIMLTTTVETYIM